MSSCKLILFSCFANAPNKISTAAICRPIMEQKRFGLMNLCSDSKSAMDEKATSKVAEGLCIRNGEQYVEKLLNI